jgi:septal ring factor EnvC (AmiA/AmiB activator)
LREADRRVAELEQARGEATARIESLEEQVRAAQRELQESSGEIRDARRRRDVAARVSSGTADRLARLARRLEKRPE